LLPTILVNSLIEGDYEMKIGFIGAGNMGEALLSGMIKGGLLST